MTESPTAEHPRAVDIATLERELSEIEMLVAQAGQEATRHEQRRSQAADKFAALADAGFPREYLDQTTQLLTLTRRAALMEAQVEVLEGKRKTLTRFRDALAAADADSPARDAGHAAHRAAPDAAEDDEAAASVSRAVLTAEERLRREISRTMHDGPAQSLTNIVLQAQIVERLLDRDLEATRTEVRHLIGMVQQTLEATKSFIFDVRPMVLDDLGLVPTLRRAARDRGRRAGVVIDFVSSGADRRLSPDLESGLFRIADEALAAYAAGAPDTLSLRLDWSDTIEVAIAARRAGDGIGDGRASRPEDTATSGGDLPPGLASMWDDRRADAEKKADDARTAAIVALPANTWREIRQRASTIDARVQLLDDGATLLVTVTAEPEPAAAG